MFHRHISIGVAVALKLNVWLYRRATIKYSASPVMNILVLKATFVQQVQVQALKRGADLGTRLTAGVVFQIPANSAIQKA